MKQNDKEKWMDEVLQSMEGSQRAKPKLELFSKIENQILAPQGKVIQFNQWKYAAAAAVLIFLVNTSALMYFNQNVGLTNEDVTITDAYNQSLISMSQIYE